MVAGNLERTYLALTKGLREAIEDPECRTAPVPPSTIGKPRASLIGSGCLRQLQYATWGVEQSDPSTSVRSQLPAKVGLALETFTTLLIRRAGFTPGHAPAEDRPWTATPDSIWEFESKLYIIEYKWAGAVRYKELLKTQSVLQAHPVYYWQVQAQLHMVPVEAAFLVVFPFDGNMVRSQMRGEVIFEDFYVECIERDPSAEPLLYDLSNTVTDAGDPDHGGILLPRGFDIQKAWQCKYCNWQGRCEEDG